MNQSKESISINKELIQDGNHLEFAKLMDYYSHDLFLFAKGVLSNTHNAEEVVSDVFLKVWERRLTIGEIANLKSYLYTSVRNHAISTLRSKRKEIVSIEDIQHYYFEPVEPSDDAIIKEEQLKKIHRAIDKLPARSKMAFSLAKVQGLKYKEIAEIMEVTVKAVDYHVAYAIQKICQMLEEDNNNHMETVKAFILLFGI